jgi:hypothetical protein
VRALNLRIRFRRLFPSTGTAEPRMTPVSASWLALFQGRRAAYTLLLLLAVGVHAMGIHLLATVLPSVVADIGGIAFYAWASMLYTMAAIIGTACGGLVMAWLGPRRTYMVGGKRRSRGSGRVCSGAAHRGAANRLHDARHRKRPPCGGGV